MRVLHRSRVIHTDLKPDNILFVSRLIGKRPLSKTAPGLKRLDVDYNYLLPISNAVKVIDFGNAGAEYYASNYTIGAPAYRAPEVILGLRWSFPSDIWSVGCILAELCMVHSLLSGEYRFQTYRRNGAPCLDRSSFGPFPFSDVEESREHRW